MKLPILALAALLGLLFLPGGCTQNLTQPQLDGRTPVVRVRVLEDVPEVTLTAAHPPTVSVSTNNTLRRLNVAPGTPVRVALSGNAWRLGNADIGSGVLTLDPAYDGTVAINGSAYRGRYRFVPTGGGRFDVVNDVDIDSYLKSVVSKELYARWHPETYRAQAIIARTYALYESKTTNAGKHFDLHADQRSQVYGGIGAETDKSREAVDATAGVVVASGRPGQERIFKAYFSSACGGVSQSATDAFGDRPHPVFREQSDQGLCSGSPKFNWGPVVVPKAEVTRRLKAWGKAKGNPVHTMGQLQRIDIEPNPLGRPVRFYLTDASNMRFMLRSEELRHGMNFAAPNDAVNLPSSFFKIVNDPANIHFVEGHGHGHGVGMCQWASQRRAEQGMRHEDIVLVAYPGSVLVRAY